MAGQHRHQLAVLITSRDRWQLSHPFEKSPHEYSKRHRSQISYASCFPALISWNEEDKTYYVTVPDLENCFTDGATLPEALENATDVLNLMLWSAEHEGEVIPKASSMDAVAKEKADDIITLVVADTEAYQEVMDRENNPIKYVRKKAGLNIKNLAELLGAHYRTVQDWNAGRRMPPKWVQRLIVEKIESAS